MRMRRAVVTLSLLAPWVATTGHAQARPGVEDLLRGRVEAFVTSGSARAGGEPIHAVNALPRFYETRGFEPAWQVDAGVPGPDLQGLLASIEGARDHGLDPGDYHQRALLDLLTRSIGTAGDLLRVDLDLLATDAFLVLGSHLLHGRVNPETIDPEWLANRRTTRMDSVLLAALEQRRVEQSLRSLAPTQIRYERARDVAARLRTLAAEGGWPQVPEGSTLQEGMVDDRVAALRIRLVASGDAQGVPPAEAAAFDENLTAAVRRFQTRHGLEVDGVVGAATLAALNVPAGQRVRTLELNMERWRWLPADLGDRHIEVNIAAFRLEVVEGGRTVRSHRVVVGRRYRQTPMFSGSMTYLVFSPFWHVPPTIAALDKLPLVQRDPGYTAAQHMVVLERSTNAEVDPEQVDWASLTGPEFNERYRFRQDPGPWNALGGVKFMFPNRHNVYLHDTPSRELFSRAARDFSSGCIRVEDPLPLAASLLADPEEWSLDRIREVAAREQERTVRLTRPIPVHLLYWTAWVDGNGVVQFRDDLYGRDAQVARALAAPPPGS